MPRAKKKAMRLPTVKVQKSSDGWRATVRSENGEVVFTSHPISRKRDVVRALVDAWKALTFVLLDGKRIG